MPDTPDPLPWDEIDATAGRPGTVLGSAPGGTGDLPTGWRMHHAPESPDGPVVLLCPGTEADVRAAAETAGPHPLVVVLPNLARPALVRAMLVGGGDDELPGPLRATLTRATVDRTLAALSRCRVSTGPAPSPAASGRPLDDLLAQVSHQAGGHDRPWSVLRYDLVGDGDGAPDPGSADRPFLSVLVRTQGRRPEPLADVLLCLAAQTSDDFELLLLAHDLGPTERDRLDETVAGLGPALRSRTRVVPVNGGGRTRPLTVGVAEAAGRYVAVLDDDDLVTAHWVEAFASRAGQAPGSVVRSVALEQDVAVEPGRPGFAPSSWPRRRWDADFSFVSHLVDNHSPVHAYAIPREVFHELGLAFDESLPVLEDWDLLVRAASLVGVRDTGEATAIYRRWPAAHTSFAEHAEEGWPDVAWRVVAGWDEAPLLLPAGSATRLRADGIYVLRHQPLRHRVSRRIDRARDRWSAAVMRTPAGRPVRWLYRRVRGRAAPTT